MLHGTSARRLDDLNVNVTVLNTRTAPRQARSARSLDLILDAAERLLQQHGVVETSTVDVAAAAGVSIGRLYYWFPDRDAVVRAVLMRSEQRLRAFVHELIVDDSERTPAELVSNLLPAVGQFFLGHQGSLAVLQRGQVDGDDPAAPLRQVFVDLIGRAVESWGHGIAAAERDLVATTVVGIVIAMLAEHIRADDQHADRYLDELGFVVTAYLHGRCPVRAVPE
jgi:AcrR family transcriptional regulator